MEGDDIPPVEVASWNVAAVNNNPFEYWITYDNDEYYSLMQGVENYLQVPENNKPISQIFTDSMFDDLCKELEAQKISGILQLRSLWETDFSQRLSISGFLKDKGIGIKRLVSMPDRITNTLHLEDGSRCQRPTVINSYDGPSLNTIEAWWMQWKIYMFHSVVQISTGELESFKPPERVCSLIGPILRSKYPAITVEEQVISVPLQILCLAIFDAIFIDMLNRVQPGTWELVRRQLSRLLIHEKTPRLCSILSRAHADADIIFLQEAAAVFIQQLEQDPILSRRFAVLRPGDLDRKRPQNSLILVARDRFNPDAASDVTPRVLALLGGAFSAPGDLLAATVPDRRGRRWLLASFHGDSNGLSAQPLLLALDRLARHELRGHLLLVGLDANTFSIPPAAAAAAAAVGAPPQHSVEAFAAFLRTRGLVSSWGDAPHLARGGGAAAATASCSRTCLQTQQGKARPFARRLSESNRHLKDWILTYASQARDPTLTSPRPHLRPRASESRPPDHKGGSGWAWATCLSLLRARA